MGLSNRLEGQVALITGGGGEIGTAIALRLASEGSAVVIGDLEVEKAEATAQKVIAQGGRASFVGVDVSDPAACEAAVAAAMASFQKLTTLVNVAAAVIPDGTVETLSLEQWNKALSVNLTGAFLMCKYGVPHMRDAGGGAIINIASQLGHMGVQGRSPYCTTKAALIFFTKILAQDHARDNIRANSISPGFILTERSSKRVGGKDKARVINGPRHLLNRPGEPEEIAAGAAFLASSDASFITGTDLLIDGGYVTFKGRMTPEGKTVMV
ncbi:MAG: short-chain dehydrogenase/reductase [Hyphomicrobiales bacterium]|jgi:NAD(P)-dependent dehydrogenase (short-subunit alcohol dehydrogenase family)|nr:short-chain dehydrogenase/reductase [Hyphomicrobiales bacterium]